MSAAASPLRRFQSAMLDRPRPLFRWLGRKMFDHIRLPEEQVERLKTLAPQGQIVYVMWTRSRLDYLCFNYIFLKLGAPLAAFANGIDLSFARGPGAWLASMWRRLWKRADDGNDYTEGVTEGHPVSAALDYEAAARAIAMIIKAEVAA